MKSNLNCRAAAWISHNQLACGFDDGTIEIHEIESRNRQLNSQMVQKIRYVQDENDRHDGSYFYVIDHPTSHIKEYSDVVLSIIWNEELNLLASSGTDERVKVLKQNGVYLIQFG
jgi:transducin (beta)-like 1